jgi:phi LC3 family holin
MINWKVRFQNPMYIVQIVAGVLIPILAYYGLNWEDMTSWTTLFDVLVRAISNPVVVAAALWNFFSATTDPTTKGIGDSPRALTYTEPK